MDYFQILSMVMQGDIKAPSLFVIMLDYEERPINYRGGSKIPPGQKRVKFAKHWPGIITDENDDHLEK